VRRFGHGYVEGGGAFYSMNLACLKDNVGDEELANAPVRYANGRNNNNWESTPASSIFENNE